MCPPFSVRLLNQRKHGRLPASYWGRFLLGRFMKIVRPYGSSRSKESAGQLRRVLVDNTVNRAERDIPAFACSHDELVIAQWISAIDKIARKPKGDKRPTAEQREFRGRLGEACWQRLIASRLSGTEGKNRQFLDDLWWFKIHPYRDGTDKPRRCKDGSLRPAPKVKGSWYEVFAGNCEPSQADAKEIASRVEEHLHQHEYRRGPDARPKREGKIKTRAESISANVFRSPKERTNWTGADLATYRKAADPAHTIYQAAHELEEGERVTLDLAGKTLFDHWRTVFCDPASGEPLSVKEARDKHPGMFALHEQLKQCYRRLLKRTRKDTGKLRNSDERKLPALLPRNLEEAVGLAQKQQTNADLGNLVRLGKIIHYAASDGKADRTQAIEHNWPENVDNSRFWASEGQAEIKRAEAFVRIWRHALVWAGLTLKDWVSMREYFKGDILGGNEVRLNEALAPDRFERGHFDRKLSLLFGNRVELLSPKTNDDCSQLLRGLIDGAANLRHAAFHFKGRGQLLDELALLPKRFPDQAKEAAQRLWQADTAARTDRLKEVLSGAYVEQFLTADQTAQIFALLTQETKAELPLPRFSRVLSRAENARRKDQAIKLPKPANRRALEAPARLCQYTVLKLLYERSFRSWLKDRGAEAISGWFNSAVARASEEAKKLRGRDNAAGKKVIAARASHLPTPPTGGDIIDFFFDLSAATASEMRIQRGYESDAQKAREQAEYIDHLLCDVMILSFSAYLSDQGLDWILDIKTDQPLPEQCSSSLNALPTQEPHLVAEDWQAALYLLLHLLPVESVGRLLHQLFKWEIAAGRETELTPDDKAHLQQLFATMTLYLDMHDAKFEGGTALVGCEEFRDLFANPTGFDRVFSQALGVEKDRRIPRRGLREIMRFGHLPLLKTISGGKKIEDAMIDRLFALEQAKDDATSQIADLQKKREDLHGRWVKAKHLDEADLREYCETLAIISQHRQDSNFVNLVDHVRAHRMILAVLGRLVDYAGLFERDLYFVTLALLHRCKFRLRPEDIFEVSEDVKKNGLKDFYNGQIIFALRKHKKNCSHADDILKQLAAYFPKVWEKKNAITQIRNNLAHLNMLQGDALTPSLTNWINQTRKLMTYDRKLKNAVSKSVIDLMAREGIELCWKMAIFPDAHNLIDATLSSRRATHLGGKRLTLVGKGSERKKVLLEESLHSAGSIAMAAVAFDGYPRPTASIVENLHKIDWKASAEK